MNSIDLSKLIDTDLYVSGIFNVDIDENSLKSLSWVDELDSSENECQEMHDSFNIDNIMTIKFKKLSDLKLLEYQNLIIGQLRKTFDNSAIKKIDWLISSSKYLSNRINLPLIQHKDNITTISRSSYKFCEMNHNCEFNYNQKKNGCYSQHFVHNLIYADLCALKNYIQNKKDNNQINEIKKSINTISYVINHMYDELQFSGNHIQRSVKKNNSKLIAAQ